MKLIHILWVVFYLCSCNNSQNINKEFPIRQEYFLYRPIKEIYDSTNEKLLYYELIDIKPTLAEKNILISILKKFNWNYKLSDDGEILISIFHMNNMEGLYLLQSELDKLTPSK